MKKIKVNTRFLATEGIPQLLTIGMIPFMMLALFSGWTHGIDTALCAITCLLCIWSMGYSEWLEVKEKISKLHFGIFGVSYLTVMACCTKLYAMTDVSETQKLFILAVIMIPCVIIAAGYVKAYHRAEKFEENDRERRIAMAGYKALWTVALFLLVYAAFFWIVYFWGSSLADLFGIERLESWQAAMNCI